MTTAQEIAATDENPPKKVKMTEEAEKELAEVLVVAPSDAVETEEVVEFVAEVNSKSTEPDTTELVNEKPAVITVAAAMEAQAEQVFKLRLGNLGKYIQTAQVKKLLTSNEVIFKNVKSAPKWDYAIATFHSEAEMNAAKTALEGKVYKKNTIEIDVLKEQVRSNSRRQQDLQKEEDEDPRTPAERIADQVTPLWRLSYDSQLAKKSHKIREQVFDYTKRLQKFIPRQQQRSMKNNNKRSNKDMQDDQENEEEIPVTEEGAEVVLTETLSAEPISEATQPSINVLNAVPADESIVQPSYIEPAAVIEESVGLTVDQIKEMDPDDRATVQLDWLADAKNQNGGLACQLMPIIPSPIVDGYRNKCEFTFGKDADGVKTVGFLVGLFKNGYTTVLNPSQCLNVADAAKKIANILQVSCRASSMDTYDRVAKTGFWRSALVRTYTTGQNMVLIQVNHTGIKPDVVAKELESMKISLLAEAEKDKLHMTSLYFQQYDGNFNGITDSVVPVLAHGKENVTEVLMGIKFLISPFSFFQVNTPATEILYKTIGNLCAESATKLTTASNEKPGIVLLDLCCGTGTIGITMAKYVKRVIAVDLVVDAIEDAKRNAAANDITNISFMCAKVEDVIYNIFKQISPTDQVIAVLDPPRVGVHYSVVQNIRSCAALKHLVFVACDLNQSMKNIVDLCRPLSNKFKGHSFVPQKMVALDLFPHTDHCEVVALFERK